MDSALPLQSRYCLYSTMITTELWYVQVQVGEEEESLLSDLLFHRKMRLCQLNHSFRQSMTEADRKTILKGINQPLQFKKLKSPSSIKSITDFRKRFTAIKYKPTKYKQIPGQEKESKSDRKQKKRDFFRIKENEH